MKKPTASQIQSNAARQGKPNGKGSPASKAQKAADKRLDEKAAASIHSKKQASELQSNADRNHEYTGKYSRAAYSQRHGDRSGQ